MFGSHDLQKIALTLVEEHPSELQNAAIVELQEQVKQLRQYITRLEERR
jgi:ubiquinone biosynthesis protein UbiJ